MKCPINVVSDVKNLGELLDGARVEQVRFSPSGGCLQLHVDLIRSMIEQKKTVRRGLFRQVVTPWIKGHLSLTEIQELSIAQLRDTPTDSLPFLSCEAIVGGYAFQFNSPDGLQLMMSVKQLGGHYADVGAPIGSL